MLPAPAASESTFVRYMRRVLCIGIGTVLSSILLMMAADLLRSLWLEIAASIIFALAALACLIASVLRVGHALWATAQYAMSELALTFFMASLGSFALLESTGSFPNDQKTTRVILCVAVSFSLFLAGSAWVWGVFRRAPQYPLNRYLALFIGWLSVGGLFCFATFALMLLIFVIDKRLPFPTALPWTAFGSLLTIPGIRVELIARQLSFPPAPPPSARNPSPPSAL